MTKRANRVAWGLAVGLAVAIIGGIAVAAPRSKSPRTVVDYYMLLPEKHFEDPDTRRELLHGGSAIVDIRNGYIHTWGDGAQPALDVCLFKRPNGSYLVAVGNNYPGDPTWEPSLVFYAYQGGRMVDVTATTLPRRFNKSLGYELPRYGTTIKVVTEAGKRVYDLVWANGRFNVKPAGRRG